MAGRITRQIQEVLASGDDGVARVTRQVVEVLAEIVVGSGRVSQQIVEVLGDSSLLEVDVGNALNFQQEVEVSGSRNLSVGSTLPIDHSVSEHLPVQNVFPANELALEQEAKRIIPVTASSLLSLTDKARRIFLLDSELELDDAALAARAKLVETFLELEGEIERQVIWHRDTSNLLELEQVAHIFLLSVGILCNYRPQVGSGSRTIPTTMPTLTPDTLTFFWPFDAASETVALHSPEFGNRFAYTANRVIRKSRRGTKQVYRKETWPSWTTIKMDLSWLNQTQVDALRDFAEDHLGQEIGLTDHEGRIWRGILTTPDMEITQLGGRDGCENYATSFEFEGVIDVPA